MIFEKTLIIAEAGVNHNGKLDLALKLCDSAKQAGADVIKFQTWITEKIITKNVKQADYQISNTGSNESQFDMLKELELNQEQFYKIKKHCDEIGIIFASTADEIDSLNFLVELGIPFIKIGSGEIGNIPFLRFVGNKDLPIILSTGMSSLSDVDVSLNALLDGGAKDISLLRCTTNYPCPYDCVNLNAMETLRNAFGYDVGYSDHTIGIEIPIAAVSKGAKLIEKHFTLDRSMKGPDHIASTEPEDFKSMVRAIRNVEEAFGSGKKIPAKTESDISNVIRKKIVASKKIVTGEELSIENICVKRSSAGLPCFLWDYVIGTQATRNYDKDEGIVF